MFLTQREEIQRICFYWDLLLVEQFLQLVQLQDVQRRSQNNLAAQELSRQYVELMASFTQQMKGHK